MFFDKIKDILSKNLPPNNTGGEVSLSVGESLLLTINICKEQKLEVNLLERLKRLYLEGIKTEEEKKIINVVTEAFFDKKFHVKSDPETTNEDPSRRYFETHLAYKILQSRAELLETTDLTVYTENSKKRLFSLRNLSASDRLKTEKIMAGDMDEKLLNKYQLEFAELAGKLIKRDYHGLSEKACENLYQIACAMILATLNTQIDDSMPLDIYSDSVFTMGMDGRGRTVKANHDKVKTTAKGLMKSISPLPIYDDLVNPIKKDYSQDEFSPFQRSADQAGFMIESDWSQHLFSRQTQPYSNGISSTTLAQIRNMALQKRLGNFHFKDQFQEYFATFAALMLYNSGGHSFFEIFEVFKLPLCRELLERQSELVEAVENDSLMRKVLYSSHHEEFNSSLKTTQEYLSMLLNKRLLNAQIKARHARSKDIFPQLDKHVVDSRLQSLHKAVLNLSADELEVILSSQHEDIDVPNHKKWSPLAVAAQLGKVDHVKVLIKAGAKINQRVDGFTPLELAIKNQKYNTAQALLEAGAKVHYKKTAKSLKEKSFALYLACRQNDMRILGSLLAKDCFKLDDIKKAISVALNIENIEAVNFLIKYIIAKDNKAFKSKDIHLLLLQAVALGNIKLINTLLNDADFPLVDIHYDQLFNACVEKGFIPAVKYILNLPKAKNFLNPIDINFALSKAVGNKDYDLAVLLIFYGADLQSLSNKSLESFNLYLQQVQDFNFLFTEQEIDEVYRRAEYLKNSFIKKNNIPNGLFENIINLLHQIFSNMFKQKHQNKTHVVQRITKIFDSKHGQNILKNQPTTLSALESSQETCNRFENNRDLTQRHAF